MNIEKRSLIPVSFGLIVLLTISACTKPKPTPTEPLYRGEASQAPKGDMSRISEDELRRQRIIQEAKDAFQTLYFSLDQSTLDAKSRSTLSGIHRFMRDNPEVSVNVAGHGDERGTDEYNLALGEKRSQAVIGYLANLGISQSRMHATSYGEERPAAEGHSESAWRQNRRAEFTPEFRF